MLRRGRNEWKVRWVCLPRFSATNRSGHFTPLQARTVARLAAFLPKPSRNMRSICRPSGHDAVRIEALVRPKVMGLDVVPVTGLPYPWQRQHAVNIGAEVRVVEDAAEVALEVHHVDQIKANQRWEQTKVGFGEHACAFPDQPFPSFEVGFQFV